MASRVIVTGGFGFIGQNLVRALNNQGIRPGIIERNIELPEQPLDYSYALLADDIIYEMSHGQLPKVDVIYHLGAITDTTCTDSELLLKYNTLFSKNLIRLAQANGTRVVYATTAGYLKGQEIFAHNRYAESKLEVDEWVQRNGYTNVVGLQLFNVLGPGESRKGHMASKAYKAFYELRDSGRVDLFKPDKLQRYGPLRRDFVYVDDVVDVFLAAAESNTNGIIQVGTGHPRTWEELASVCIQSCGDRCCWVGYVEPPDDFQTYQTFSQADLANLQKLMPAGWLPRDLESGIQSYYDYLRETK